LYFYDMITSSLPTADKLDSRFGGNDVETMVLDD
jgi:hypothetical protein